MTVIFLLAYIIQDCPKNSNDVSALFSCTFVPRCVVHFVMEMGHSVIVFRIAFCYNEYTGISFSEYETGESE